MNQESADVQKGPAIEPAIMPIPEGLEAGVNPQGTGEQNDFPEPAPSAAAPEATSQAIPTLSAEAEADGRINPHANPRPDQLMSNIPPSVQGN